MEFIGDFVKVFGTAPKEGPDFRAAVFERWQMFEIEYDDNISALVYTAGKIVSDARFTKALDKEVATQVDCLRDTSGILFRFHGLIQDGDLVVQARHSQRLKDAIEAVLAPFERRNPVEVDGHFVGALYMQVVTAFLAASRNATSNVTLRALTQRVGKAIVHWYSRRGCKRKDKDNVCNRLHETYMMLSHNEVWGSQTDDLVWATFIK